MLSWQLIQLAGLLLQQSPGTTDRGAAPAAPLPTHVRFAAGPREPAQQALVEEVVRVLQQEQPQNPGRKKTFIKLELRGLTPQNRGTHLLQQAGWVLLVQEAGRIDGGWRATVAVQILATTLDGWPVQVSNQHFEVYVYKGGKLILEDDYTDPELQFRTDYKLSDGLQHQLMFFPKMLPTPDPYNVDVLLEGKPTEADKRLAEEVRRVLKREQPQNPGRLKSFPKLEVDWPAGDGKHTVHHKFEVVGWYLLVRRAERIPGGWRATVSVAPQVRDKDYVPRRVDSRHTEVYRYRDGKLTLESESLDPNRDRGLIGWP